VTQHGFAFLAANLMQRVELIDFLPEKTARQREDDAQDRTGDAEGMQSQKGQKRGEVGAGHG